MAARHLLPSAAGEFGDLSGVIQCPGITAATVEERRRSVVHRLVIVKLQLLSCLHAQSANTMEHKCGAAVQTAIN